MSTTPAEVLGAARWATLILCLGAAAWMDHRNRRVPNEHWIAWSKPLILIWALEFIVREADWTIWASALAVLCLASISIIGRPTLADILKGSRIDIAVSTAYLIGIAGLVAGGMRHATGGVLPLLDGTASDQTVLWFEVIMSLVMVAMFMLAWRLRFLHGGADAKGMMWVAMLLPAWSGLYTMWSADAVVRAPPAVSLFIWGGFSFLLIPVIILLLNIKNGNLRSSSDLKMCLASVRMPLSEIQDRHVWLLDSVMEMPDGTTRVRSRARAPRHTPSDEELAEQIKSLADIGQESAWVAFKFPLLTMLFPAVIPMILIGDPIAFIFALVEG